MISLMTEVRDNYGVVTDESEFFDFLLEKMEETGMLPPLRERTEHEKKIFGTKEDGFDLGYGKRSWDDE